MLPHPFTPWSKHINAAADLDRLLLNALPRKDLFAFNPGGYQTFNFVPAIATMALGLLCGRLLRGPRSDWAKVGRLVLFGMLLTAAGWAAGEYLLPAGNAYLDAFLGAVRRRPRHADAQRVPRRD